MASYLFSNYQGWWLAARPKTLIAAAAAVTLGTAEAVLSGGTLDPILFFSALFFAFFIQISCNYFNDALDFQKGADTENRLGPTRSVQAGLVKPEAMLIAATGLLILSFFIGLPMMLQGGWPFFAVVLISMAFAFAYTGGPFPLAYLGLGEVFVILCFGVMPFLALHSLFGSTRVLEACLGGIQMGSLACLLLAINNARDIEEDKISRKKTLAVRFGIEFAKREIAFFAFFPFLLGVAWIFFGQSQLCFLPVMVFPIAFSLVRKIWVEPPSAIYNVYLGQAALLMLLFTSLQMIGIFAELLLVRGF